MGCIYDVRRVFARSKRTRIPTLLNRAKPLALLPVTVEGSAFGLARPLSASPTQADRRDRGTASRKAEIPEAAFSRLHARASGHIRKNDRHPGAAVRAACCQA